MQTLSAVPRMPSWFPSGCTVILPMPTPSCWCVAREHSKRNRFAERTDPTQMLLVTASQAMLAQLHVPLPEDTLPLSAFVACCCRLSACPLEGQKMQQPLLWRQCRTRRCWSSLRLRLCLQQRTFPCCLTLCPPGSRTSEGKTLPWLYLRQNHRKL